MMQSCHTHHQTFHFGQLMYDRNQFKHGSHHQRDIECTPRHGDVIWFHSIQRENSTISSFPHTHSEFCCVIFFLVCRCLFTSLPPPSSFIAFGKKRKHSHVRNKSRYRNVLRYTRIRAARPRRHEKRICYPGRCRCWKENHFVQSHKSFSTPRSPCL